MIKTLQKSAILMALLGLLMAAAAPSAMAQGRNKCRNRNSNYYASNYYNDDDRRDSNYERSRRYRDRDYYDREDTTGNAVKRTGIGAGIGALGGAVIGGKKGAAIGAGIGAAGGYLYHRKKVGDERDRRYRY
jgi:hypothetical protein